MSRTPTGVKRFLCRIFGCEILQGYCGGPWCNYCGADDEFYVGPFWKRSSRKDGQS